MTTTTASRQGLKANLGGDVWRLLVAVFLLLCLSLQSSAAFAAGRTVPGQKVVRFSTGWAAEGIYVNTDISAPVVDGCGGNNYVIEPAHPMLKEILTLLITARQSGTAVDLYAEGCFNNSMILKAVSM